ncbi:hypothetical protein D3C77_295840 [compost metagenome]
MLQLLQYELGNDDRPFDKPRLANVSDSPIDNDARIENLMLLQLAFFPLSSGSPFARFPERGQLFLLR